MYEDNDVKRNYDATEIDTDNEIVFKKISDCNNSNERQYKEVLFSDFSFLTGDFLQKGFSLSDHTMVLSQIEKQASNGLFSVNINPEQLSKFSNGTTTTMVRDETGKLIRHEGFYKIDFQSYINPIIIVRAGMQVMAAISGTYYLHRINTHLTKIDTKLDKLFSIHNDIDIGNLISTRKFLSKIAEKEYIDDIDLSLIGNYKKSVDAIYEQYLYRLKKNDFDEENLKINNEILIAFEANKLSIFAEAVGIVSRMKANNHIEQVHELIIQLKKNYEESIYFNSKSIIEEIYLPRKNKNKNAFEQRKNKLNNSMEDLLKRYNLFRLVDLGSIPELSYRLFIVNNSRLKLNKVTKIIEFENKYYNNLMRSIEESKDSDELEGIVKSVIGLNDLKREIIYMPIETNKHRIFIPVSEEIEAL